jgi:hypothetical protein
MAAAAAATRATLARIHIHCALLIAFFFLRIDGSAGLRARSRAPPQLLAAGACFSTCFDCQSEIWRSVSSLLRA